MKMYISLFLFHDWFPLEFVFTLNISLMWCEINSKEEKISILKLIKRRSQVQEKNISCERNLNFDQ